jgi:pimeloyl-ACP methyl ester carboxylesterase
MRRPHRTGSEVKMDAVEVDGLRVAYHRAGTGEPVVLLHGFVGDSWSTWHRQIADLADDFTVVAWDAPGAGQSADPPVSFRLVDYTRCLSRFLRLLGLGSCHLVGLSFGSILALDLYREEPTVVRSLLLAGAYAGWTGSLPAEEVAGRLDRSLNASQLSPDDFTAAMLPSMFSATAPPDRVAEFARSVAEFHPVGFRAMARASAEADLRAVLPTIAVPTMLITGGSDSRSPRRVGEAMHSAIPASRLVILDGVGHASPIEAADEFTAHARSHLVAVPS